MQLAFDAADRLVDTLEERRAPLTTLEAARLLFAARSVPEALARSLIADVVAGDARLRVVGGSVALAGARDPLLEDAAFCVVDLETTGLSAATARICEIGAVRVRGLELVDEFETLVNPGEALPRAVAELTGIDPRELRGAPPIEPAFRRFLAFAGDAVLVAHNARFDLAFIDRQLERVHGRKRAAYAVDTLALARRLLAGRSPRASLAALAYFFGTEARPCHRALADARATAEILCRLIGLAQERGARTLADLQDLAAPRARKVYAKRALVHGAPPRPGVYRFHDRHGQVLYVGRARDLRARLRSYFRSDRQRPAVEGALAAVERIEWQVLGSELEAALEELRLIRELRPPANARGARPDRYVYLRRRGAGLVVSATPTELGPLKSRRQAQLACRIFETPLPELRAKLRDLAGCLRYEDAARLRDRIDALERVRAQLGRLERLRASELCLIVPALEPGRLRAVFVACGRVAAVRSLPPGGGAALELAAGIAAARAAEPSLAPEDADELLLVAAFVRRPPPELHVFGFDADAIARRLPHLAAVAAEAA